MEYMSLSFFWSASKQRRVDFDEAVDDVILIVLAQKLRHRLSEDKAETSTSRKEWIGCMGWRSMGSDRMDTLWI